MRRTGPALALVSAGLALLAGPSPLPRAAAGDGETTAPLAAGWLDDPGTAVLGFGLLRVAPEKPGAPGTVRVHYAERPGAYGAFDAVQLMVLPRDAFAKAGRATATDTLAFDRSGGGEWGGYDARVEWTVTEPALVVVGFGPFVGPDTGRPLTLARAYTMEVAGTGASWRWVDAEAGELNVKGWTNRPDVPSRGASIPDPRTLRPHWFEVRPLVVFDRERVRAPDDPEAPGAAALRAEADLLDGRARSLEAQGKADVAEEVRAEAADLRRSAAAEDPRLPLPATLAAKFRRLPFRWK